MIKVNYKVEAVNCVDIILSNKLKIINIIIFIFDFVLKR